MGNPDMVVVINNRALLIKGTDWKDYFEAILRAIAMYRAELDQAMKEFKENEAQLKDDFNPSDWYEEQTTIKTIRTYVL